MAVAMERFSIREYAAKMRSVDLGKCWPFDGDGREGSLPPIRIRRFRWWSDELEAAGSSRTAGDNPETEKDAAGDESMVEVPTADGCVVQDPGAEGRQTRTSGKAKQRAPKKRSMKELFAVAPPVEAIDDEADGDEDDPEDDVVDGEQHGEAEEESSEASDGQGEEPPETSEAPAKRKETMRKKTSMKEKRKKKKNTTPKKKVEIFSEIKEKVRKPKVPPSVNISHILQDLVQKRWFENASRIPVDSQKKKPTATKSQGKIIQTSKLMSRNQRKVAELVPIHGILKNQIKGTSIKKASTLVKSCRGNLKKLCCESAKHVSFSGKDAILGHNKTCSMVELSQLQSLCKIFSDVLAASSAMDNSSKDKLSAAVEGAQVVNVSGKDVATSALEWSDGSLSQKKQLSDSHGHAIPPMSINPSNRDCVDVQKISTAEKLDLNVMQSNIDLNCLNLGTTTLPPSLKHSGDPKVLNFINHEELTSDAQIHLDGSFPRSSHARSLLAPTGKCVSGSDTMSSLTITSTPRSQHSASSLVTSFEANGRQFQPSRDPNMDFSSHIPEFQPKRHLFPQDLSNIYSPTGSKRSGESSLTSGPGSTCKDKCIFEDFIGLPLNSQGELIKLHPGPDFGFNELYKKQSSIRGPIHGFSVHNYFEPNSVDHVKMKEKFSGAALYLSDQPNWFPERSCPASELVTSGLGFSELQGFEQMKIQNHVPVKDKNRFIHCDENPKNFVCHGCRENNPSLACIDMVKFQAEGNLNHEFLPATQPTMRLMGKDVTVGRASKECHGFHSGRIWTDEGIVTEHCSSLRVSDKPLPKRWPTQELIACPSSASLKENQLQPLEAQSRFHQRPPILPRSDQMHLDCRQQWMLRNGTTSTVGNQSYKLDPFRRPLATQHVLNETCKSIFNSVSGAESVTMRHQIPVVASHPQDVYQHMLLNSTHCKHTQSVSYSTSSTFHPPFPYKDHVGLAQQPLAPSSSKLPQWLLNAKQQKKNQQSSSPPYSNSVAMHHPSGMSGTDLFPLPSPYPTSIIPFPVYSSSTSQICGPFTPAPVLHPSYIPEFTASRSSSAVKNSCRNKNKNINGTKSKLTYFKGVDHAERSRKRPAAKDDEFMKPAKKACLKMQEDSNAPTCPSRREQFHGCSQQNIATPESHVYGNRAIDAGVTVVVSQKDGVKSSSEPCSSKFGGASRAGPIKLSAGAKHILKPSLTLDQDCPKPIHATIPFSIGTNSGKLLASQKKATKVYKF